MPVKATITPERSLIVFMEDRNIALTVPEGCKITFGPWSPPNMQRTGRGMYDGPTPQQMRGTLRVYKGSKENIIALITGVLGFYEEEMAVNEVDVGMLGYANLGPKPRPKGKEEEEHPSPF